MWDIGKLKDNRKFCDEDGMDDIILKIKEDPTTNIYIGEIYFYDIFRKPPLHGLGWRGFTRDYHEMKGAFDSWGEGISEIVNPKEYLEDIMQYKDKDFMCEETSEVFELIADFLRYAIETKQTVIVKVE